MKGFVGSHGIVAAVAAAISAVATVGGTKLVTPSAAQPAAGGVRQILAQPLADLPGREVGMSVLDRAPGSSSPAHRHPGHHTFGYVMEGTYEFAIDGQLPRLLNAGDTFYEPPSVIHSTSRNPST